MSFAKWHPSCLGLIVFTNESVVKAKMVYNNVISCLTPRKLYTYYSCIYQWMIRKKKHCPFVHGMILIHATAFPLCPSNDNQSDFLFGQLRGTNLHHLVISSNIRLLSTLFHLECELLEQPLSFWCWGMVPYNEYAILHMIIIGHGKG